jgi:hypothetical protein
VAVAPVHANGQKPFESVLAPEVAVNDVAPVFVQDVALATPPVAATAAKLANTRTTTRETKLRMPSLLR